jgi:hypothetical protein
VTNSIGVRLFAHEDEMGAKKKRVRRKCEEMQQNVNDYGSRTCEHVYRPAPAHPVIREAIYGCIPSSSSGMGFPRAIENVSFAPASLGQMDIRIHGSRILPEAAAFTRHYSPVSSCVTSITVIHV